MNNRLYVGNLSFDVTEDALRACFAEHGEVTATRMIMDRVTGRPRGFAFVTMGSDADAEKAMAQLDGAVFAGRPLRVNVAEERARTDDRTRAPAAEFDPTSNRNERGGHRGW